MFALEFRTAGASLHETVSLPKGYTRPRSSKLRPVFVLRAARALQYLFTALPAPKVDLFVTTVTGPTTSDPVGFDSYIYLGFAGWNTDRFISALVDSGNTTLIVPYWEEIAAIPDSQSLYTVLGTAPEPWGCPANVVRGPIQIATADGQALTIPDCEFYACTDISPRTGTRTSNFGAGCIKPWSAGFSNVPNGVNTVLQSPLSYLASYSFAEFHFAGKSKTLSTTPNVSERSILRLHSTAPTGFTMMEIVQDIPWMALRPLSLSIGGTLTQWPGATPAIALLDTGGGPAYLADPSGFVCETGWSPIAPNPGWTSTSTNCNSTLASVNLTLGDETNSFSYTIDENLLPAAAQGLVLVMCEDNHYMFGQYGMNIGGISMLVIRMLIDFQHAKVGLALAP